MRTWSLMLRYKKMFVMWPPRPEGSIPPEDLPRYPGWLVQRKFNGTRTLVFLDPDGRVHLRGRHQQNHRAYKPTSGMLESLGRLRESKNTDATEWQVFDGELLHNKTRNLKDRLVLFDVLVHDGQYLIGTSCQDRVKLLSAILGDPKDHESETGRQIALSWDKRVWLAETFSPKTGTQTIRLFQELLDLDEIEGLVLKDPLGRLEPGVTEKNNSSWLIRCRKPHKNYQF